MKPFEPPSGESSPRRRKFSMLDQCGLVIIGAGASLLYYAIEKVSSVSEDLSVMITMSAILMISIFTQVLLNNINRTQQALREANETLESKVTERTVELRRSENNYRAIFENTGTATIICNEDLTIFLANSMFVNISGYHRDELENCKNWTEFLEESLRRRVVERGWRLFTDKKPGNANTAFECKFTDKKNQIRDVLVFVAAIPDAKRYVVSLADITKMKEAEQRIYHQAFHDSLTNLPNRSLFIEHLNLALKRNKRRKDNFFAVIHLDIDRFKVINDSLGHHIGDQLLIAFANRIQGTLREIDTLARLGGDEFLVLLEDIENSQAAIHIAERLQKNLQSPFNLGGQEIFAPASMGIVLETRVYRDAEDIIRDADAAMHDAKENGRAQYRVFSPALHTKALNQLQIETDLRKAIRDKEFELYYQPIVVLNSGDVIGFEALIRWNHPQQGLILPDHFIPVAEETGLIIPIGQWVLREACQDLVRWQRSVGAVRELFMSVNISSKQFLRPSIIEEIKSILVESGLPPGQLKLEITETAIMENTDQTIRLIHHLKEYGVKIVIDDFGTGYSSMSYLQQLPVETLKVDKSFVSRMKSGIDENTNIVETIITLAHKLRMNVVAEGVETIEQQRILNGLKCQLAQGYLFSRPLRKKKAVELLEGGKPVPTVSPLDSSLPLEKAFMESNRK